MARRHSYPFTALILVSMVVLSVPVPVAAEDAAGSCPSLPRNVEVASVYRDWIVERMAQSATLMRQCRAIARTPGVRITLDSSRRFIGPDRARTSFARDDGRLWAVISIPMTRDFVELLAHELEHVLEQIEGVDLRQRAQARESGVREVAPNVFETTRALEAGRAAQRETRLCSTGAASCGARVTLVAVAD